ncbi:MAG: spinster family MFS transporter [Gemmataceae bacterium]
MSRRAWLALALLLSINLFNYIDRYVLAAVEEPVQREVIRDDVNGMAKFGWLATSFLVVYMVIAPIFGWLGDRFSRWWLIGIGVIIWSLASGASGMAELFIVLLITRCFVGFGEGAYGPVAPTVISDMFPVASRGKVMALFYLAIPVGSSLGFALGTLMMSWVDWRWAFYAVVPPGIALGVICFWMREPPRGQADATIVHRAARWADYRTILRTPSYVLDTVGMTAMTFAIGGLAWWMPAYLTARQVDDLFGMAPGIVFGLITALAGLTATLSGGLAGDWLRKYHGGSYFLVSGAAMLIAFPMILLVVKSPFPVAWIFLFLSVFCIFFNTGPTNTILANVTHPAVRGSAFALNIFLIHAFGDAISPFVIGAVADTIANPMRGEGVADHVAKAAGLDGGFILVSVLVLVGGAAWLYGARYLQRDTELAPTRLDETTA